MIIDLHRKVISMQLRRFITLILFIIIVLICMLMLDFQQSYLGMTKYQLAICFAIIYVLIAVYVKLRELNYIYYSDVGDKIVLRYFSTSFFNRKKQLIEIPKIKFSGYEIKQEFSGFRKKLILKQIIKVSEAKYPPVSITLLGPDQLEMLIESLNNCLVHKENK